MIATLVEISNFKASFNIYKIKSIGDSSKFYSPKVVHEFSASYVAPIYLITLEVKRALDQALHA